MIADMDISKASFSRRGGLKALAALPLSAVAQGQQVTPVPGGYTAMRKVKLWESTRKEFREALEGGRLQAMIVPTGSTEQHNEHLAMIHDTASVVLVAEMAALKVFPKAMVATPVSIGISPHWMDRKGTLSLRQETFLAVVYDICDSLKTHGVKNILILNGHGGNVKPLADSTPGFRSKLGINVQFSSYWDGYTKDEIKKNLESNVMPGHAAEFETSFAMAAFPERVHWEGVDYQKVKPTLNLKSPQSAAQEEQFAREAKLAATWKGEAMLASAVDWVAARVERMISGA